jgi:hypothetical protein
MFRGEPTLKSTGRSLARRPVRQRLRDRFMTVPIALLLCASFVGAPRAQQESTAVSPCDPKLIPPKGDPLAYGRRGERCEGLYVLEVAGSAGLSLVAFTAAAVAGPLKPDDRLHVQWPLVPGNPAMHLRAVSLRPRVYYRMDAVRAPDTDRFEWPANLVVQLNLSGSELGVVGWVRQTIGEKTDDVYVPVRIGTSPEPASKGYYVAQIVPGAELAELFVTLAAIGPDGRDEKYLKRDEPLKYGFYPAGRAISLKLPALPAAGLYRLRLGALVKSGGAANTVFVFRHSGM